MTPSQIAVMVAEARATSIGARVNEVLATETECLVIGLRVEGTNLRLLLSCHPALSRVHFVSEEPLGQRKTPFSELAAARLTGKRLAAIEQPVGEKAVRLWFGGEDSEGLCLVAELFGKRPNLVLHDSAGTILGAWRTFPAGARPIAPGAKYVPLPPREAKGEEGPPWTSAEWEASTAPKERELLLATLRARAEESLGGELYRIDGVLRGLEAGLDACHRCEEVRKAGEVLKANLGQVPRGAERVELPDFFNPKGGMLAIELDPRMGPRENLERIFKKYRRLRDSAERLETRIAAFRTRRAQVVATLNRARAGTDPESFPALEPAAKPQERKARSRKGEKGAPAAIRRFVSRDGIGIWVGRTDRENDHLTFRLARGNDHWLHTKDFAGSHVVVRTGKRELTQEALLDAAHLAVYYSKARGQAAVDVTYTQAKYVRKPRGARPGQVALGDSRTITLRWEEARMARLAAGIAETGEEDEGEDAQERP